MSGSTRKQTERLNLSKRTVEALNAPDRGRRWVHDQKTPGLAVAITPNETKSWYWYRWSDGRPKRMSIGRFPAMTAEQARKRVEQLNGELAAGGDPTEQRRQRRSEATLGEVWSHYLEHHAKPHKRTWAEDKRTWTLYLEKWSGRRLSAISKADVLKLHGEVSKRGKVQANRVLALLSAIYGHAVDYFGHDRIPPTKGVKKNRETPRERWLDGEELARFMLAVDDPATNSIIGDFIRLALFTGQRRGNVQSMGWGEVDTERKLWTIGAEKTKTARAYHVPLTDAAIDVLNRRRRLAGEDAIYVLPGRRHGSHLQEIKTTFTDVLDRAGISDFRPHDLRHTLASWMATTGASEYLIARALGHAAATQTARYSHLSAEPVREAMNTALHAMLAAVASHRAAEADELGVAGRIG